MAKASHIGALDKLRSRWAASHSCRPGATNGRPLSFGVPAVDGQLPAKGLAPGALHEFEPGAGRPDDCAPTLLMAGLLAQTRGPVLWVMQRKDLFAPALASVGLHPSRLIYVEAGKDVLLVVEEALRHRGLAGVVGELNGRMTMTASRRLQLAAEASGTVTFIHRRAPSFTAPEKSNGVTVALTKWQVASVPSREPIPGVPEILGLFRARWHLALVRCRGGEPSSWMVEACDAQGRLALVSDAADRQAAPCDIRNAA